MIELVLASLVWLASHIGLSSTPLRAQIVAWIGETGFKIGYALLSFAVIFWLVGAYNDAPYVELWSGGVAGSVIALLTTLLAFLLLVAGVSQRNPTSAAVSADRPGEPKGVLRVTRHPVMWAIGLWAVGHLVANGDLASLLFFGSMAVLAIWGTRLIDIKAARRFGEAWAPFESATSNVPFGTVAAGRQPIMLTEIGWWRIALGLVLFVALLLLHPALFGVGALPR